MKKLSMYEKTINNKKILEQCKAVKIKCNKSGDKLLFKLPNNKQMDVDLDKDYRNRSEYSYLFANNLAKYIVNKFCKTLKMKTLDVPFKKNVAILVKKILKKIKQAKNTKNTAQVILNGRVVKPVNLECQEFVNKKNDKVEKKIKEIYYTYSDKPNSEKKYFSKKQEKIIKRFIDLMFASDIKIELYQ